MSFENKPQNPENKIDFSDGINTKREKILVLVGSIITMLLTWLYMRKRLKKAYGKAIKVGKAQASRVRSYYSRYRKRRR